MKSPSIYSMHCNIFSLTIFLLLIAYLEAFAGEPQMLEIKVIYPEHSVELFSGPRLEDDLVRTIAGKDFPAKVLYFEEEGASDAMYHIRFEDDPVDYWVFSDDVIIQGKKIVVPCDHGQDTSTGNLGRGMGEEIICD